MNEKKNLTIKETFSLALQNHKKNNLKVTEKLCKEILNIDSSHFDSNFLMILVMSLMHV